MTRQRSREQATRALGAYSRSATLEGAELRPDAVLALLEGQVVSVYDIFEAVVAVLSGGPDRLCEKTPGHLWWWQNIVSARPSTRFAMIVRDPRAVIASMVEANFTTRLRYLPTSSGGGTIRNLWRRRGTRWFQVPHSPIRKAWLQSQQVAPCTADAVPR